jgi:hypothetical protein
MRPEISEELVDRVIKKWKLDNRLAVDLPKSKIIEDILLRYLEGQFLQKVKDRRRDKIFRTFVKMKSKIRPVIRHNSIRINSTEFGSIMVNNKRYSYDVMVSYRGLVKNVETEVRHLVSRKEFYLMLAEEPEVIVIGTGVEGGMQISSDVRRLAEQKGIQVIDLKSSEAIKKFNQLYESGKRVVAFIHTTC